MNLSNTAHRPWPIPSNPWIMAQVWHDLLFAHWPVSIDALRSLVPAQLPLDTFDGRAWVAVVPFTMSDIRLRWSPTVPGLSTFPELNVRTYVTVGDKPGVYFFSLDAGNPLAVLIARAWFHLPYYWATMSARKNEGAIHYQSARHFSRRGIAELTAVYKPTGAVFHAEPGTLPYWLIERYCLYTVGVKGDVSRGDIHHAPWDLQLAEATIDGRSMAAAAGLSLPSEKPLLHFSRRQEVVVWPPTKLPSSDL